MAYLTTYTIKSLDGDAMAFAAAFDAHPLARDDGFRFFGIAVPSERMTWYDHDAHIAAAMCGGRVTKLVLHCEGEGEGAGDVRDKEYLRDESNLVYMTEVPYELKAGTRSVPRLIGASAEGSVRHG